MCKAKLSHLAFAAFLPARVRKWWINVRNSPLHCVLSLQTTTFSLFRLLPSCMKISSPSNKPTCYILMRLIIISHVICALRSSFCCSHTEFITWGLCRRYVNRWHSSFYTDILRSMCEEYTGVIKNTLSKDIGLKTVTFTITFAIPVSILKMFTIFYV